MVLSSTVLHCISHLQMTCQGRCDPHADATTWQAALNADYENSPQFVIKKNIRPAFGLFSLFNALLPLCPMLCGRLAHPMGFTIKASNGWKSAGAEHL